MSVTKVVKADKLYDQTYRGFASRGLQSPFLPVPLRGTPLLPNHNPGFQPWVVRGLGAPVPLRLGASKETSSMTTVVKEGYIYHQTYRGSTSRGLKSPFLPVPLSGAHRFLPIIAQDFSPGRPFGPAESRQSGQSL